MRHPLHGIPADPHGSKSQQGRNPNRANGFDALMAVRVAFIGGRGPEFYADQDEQIGHHIGERMNRIRQHGLRTAEKSKRKFKTRQQKVDGKSDPRDLLSLLYCGVHSWVKIINPYRKSEGF